MKLTLRLGTLADDLRFALRQMRRAPLFTLAAVSTLALGIGANSAMFALADAALLRPLPFDEPERLVLVNEYGPQESGRSRIQLLNFHEWTRQARSFDSMAAAWVPGGDGGLVLTAADGMAETVPTQTVTPQFFDVLGVRPFAGRTFRPDDDSTSPSVVVLSEGFWRRRFGADPSIVGRAITLNERPMTVIGIAPADFQFVRPAGAWALLPLPSASGSPATRGQCGTCRLLQVVARLKPGVGLNAAQAELTALANSLPRPRTIDRPGPQRITMSPLRDAIIGREVRVTALLFLGVVAMVLLLCCANVANLVLTRSAARQRELSIRAALGASRARIAGQMLTESLALATLGGGVGVAISLALLEFVPPMTPAGLLPAGVSVSFDARVAAFCALVAVVTGVLVAVAPAWHVSRRPLAHAVGAGDRAVGGGGWLRNVLVAGEVAVAVLVLCGAGLLLRTLLAVGEFDRGYTADPARVLTARLDIPSRAAGSRYESPEALIEILRRVEREVAATPGVASVGFGTTLPVGGSQLGAQSFEIVGAPVPAGADRPEADNQIVTPGYFRTLGLPIVIGRAFTDQDTAASPNVAIVSEAFASRYLQGRDPIGTQILYSAAIGARVPRTIVGVAKQVKGRPDESEDLVQIYVPSAQIPFGNTNLLVRSAGPDAAALAAAVRGKVASVDPLLPLNSVMTLDAIAGVATDRHRFRARLVIAFAVLALTLAMIGVFGVLAYSVQQRWREFGVRLALGARTATVLTMVMGTASRLVFVGAAIGLTLAATMARSLDSFLFGVEPLDPATFTAVAATIVACGLAASAVPAIRASRVDPSVVFRQE